MKNDNKKLNDVITDDELQMQEFIELNQKFLEDVIMKIDACEVAIAQCEKFNKVLLDAVMQAIKATTQIEERVSALKERYDSDHNEPDYEELEEIEEIEEAERRKAMWEKITRSSNSKKDYTN